MPSPIVRSEIGSKDSAATAAFYDAVFGWKTAAQGLVHQVITGHQGGPTAMLNALGHPPDNYVLIYSEVDDIDAALDRVAAAGGSRFVGPISLPDGRRFAWVSDTGSNLIGLVTPSAA
jgi:predicted enzyme related to lactoylglutathione lyase